MATPPRTPPRFVPTLTEVVQVPDATPHSPAAAAPSRTTVMPPHAVPPAVVASSAAGRLASAAPAPAMAAPTAAMATPPAAAAVPRVSAPPPVAPAVGVRTGAVATAPVAASAPVAATRAPAANSLPSVASAARLADGTEEYVVHRVMQRVDVVLEKRLRDAIATVVQEQTRSVLPRLREEIESVVRHAVYEAVADELASSATPRQ